MRIRRYISGFTCPGKRAFRFHAGRYHNHEAHAPDEPSHQRLPESVMVMIALTLPHLTAGALLAALLISSLIAPTGPWKELRPWPSP
jgi:hypothetical protein